tara:strand:+ start:343 stop:525 length:183 start_codon:yes stop_codon:yes gene_type:complete
VARLNVTARRIIEMRYERMNLEKTIKIRVSNVGQTKKHSDEWKRERRKLRKMKQANQRRA